MCVRANSNLFTPLALCWSGSIFLSLFLVLLQTSYYTQSMHCLVLFSPSLCQNSDGWSVSIFHVNEHPQSALGGNDMYRTSLSREPHYICQWTHHILSLLNIYFLCSKFVVPCLISTCVCVFVFMFVWQPVCLSRCWRSSRPYCPHHNHPPEEH